MYKNTAYSSLCKLNIYLFLSKLQKGISQDQWEMNMNDRQQEY